MGGSGAAKPPQETVGGSGGAKPPSGISVTRRPSVRLSLRRIRIPYVGIFSSEFFRRNFFVGIFFVRRQSVVRPSVRRPSVRLSVRPSDDPWGGSNHSDTPLQAAHAGGTDTLGVPLLRHTIMEDEYDDKASPWALSTGLALYYWFAY